MTKATKLASVIIVILLSIGCLFKAQTAQTAQSGFRKALDAYTVRDGHEMLAAVKEAVESKNNDGLVLFISALQLDEVTSKSRLYLGSIERKSIYSSNPETEMIQAPLESMLCQKEIDSMLGMLDIAIESANLDSKYEYLILRYGSVHPTLEILSKKKNLKMHDVLDDRSRLVKGMTKLAEKGYGKAAYFLHLLPKYAKRSKSTSNRDWEKLAIASGYELKFLKSINLSLPKMNIFTGVKPVISIEKYSNRPLSTFIDTNYVLDVYSDGSINFNRGALVDIPRTKNRIVNKVSPTEVQGLIATIKDLGFYMQNKYNSDIPDEDEMGATPSFGQYSIRRSYLITLRENGNSHQLIYKVDQAKKTNSKSTDFLQSFLQAVESKAQTQFYRCGLTKDRDYFKFCTTKDL